jgi:hypothetical protein
MSADALFDLADITTPQPEHVYSVHCFFNCGHVTKATDPKTSGDAMEQHYSASHSADIDRALGFIGVGARQDGAQSPPPSV